MAVKKSRHTIVHFIITSLLYTIEGIVFSVAWIAVAVGGFLIFQTKNGFFSIVLGLPFMFVGAGFAINKIATSMFSVFSPRFNRAVCKLCKYNDA